MFTYQQIQAMREHRFGRQDLAERRGRGRPRQPSLYELLMALADGLARIGRREPDGRIRPASPAY